MSSTSAVSPDQRQREWAVARKGDRFRVVGEIIASDSGRILRTPDGREEPYDVARRYDKAHEGTLKYEAADDLEALQAVWDERPVELVVRLLRELRQPATGQQVREKLHDLGLSGLDEPSWKTAWKTLQPQLKAHEHVGRNGSKYVWSETALEK